MGFFSILILITKCTSTDKNTLTSLSTKWVDYVEEPMKYQALRPQFFLCGWEGVVGVGVGSGGGGGG